MERAIIIDGNSVLYKTYYANKFFSKSKEEQPTEEKEDIEKQKQTIIISVRKVCESFLKMNNYKYLIVAFDSTKETFRRKKCQDYKANRASMPKVLFESLEDIKKSVTEIGFNVVPAPVPYEADDVICTLSKEFDKLGIKTDIFSTDNDLLQLVSYYTTVFIWKTQGIKQENNFKNFHEQNEGLSPKQIPQLKAISGDSSDNYKGAKGIGDKIAKKLLLEYGSINKIYENLDNLSEKQKKIFTECKQDVYDCLDLATTRNNLDLSFKLENYVRKIQT